MALTDTKTTARRSLGELFACLFKKYPKLLIANLLFAVPLAVSALIVWLIGAYVMPLNIFFPAIAAAYLYAVLRGRHAGHTGAGARQEDKAL